MAGADDLARKVRSEGVRAEMDITEQKVDKQIKRRLKSKFRLQCLWVRIELLAVHTRFETWWNLISREVGAERIRLIIKDHRRSGDEDAHLRYSLISVIISLYEDYCKKLSDTKVQLTSLGAISDAEQVSWQGWRATSKFRFPEEVPASIAAKHSDQCSWSKVWRNTLSGSSWAFCRKNYKLWIDQVLSEEVCSWFWSWVYDEVERSFRRWKLGVIKN